MGSFTKYMPGFLARQFEAPQLLPEVVIPLEHAERHPSVISKAEMDGEKQRRDSIKREGSSDNESAEKGLEGFGDKRGSLAYDVYTIEGLRAEVEADVTAFGHDSEYDRKAKLINKAIQDMGMGRYQWELFVLCGFGWFADNFWLQGVALVLSPIAAEFGVTDTNVRFTTLSLFLGLCIGASFWGIASDVVGRRIAFNTTLFIGGVFGLAAGGGPTWIGTCALISCMGLGVGGNLPVDGALFLEFLPMASGNMLTLLSIWWPVGSLVASMIGWGLIPQYSCTDAQDNYLPACSTGATPCCTRASNMGWRYFLFTLGSITILQWCARFILFRMFESPKFLLSRGRQDEAVAVIHGIAKYNKQKTWLTTDILNEIAGVPNQTEAPKLSVLEIVKRSLSKFSAERFGPLFSYWKLGLTTVLLWIMWATIGLGYPLFNAFLVQYLGDSGAASTYITYRNYAITTVVGVPGSAIAYYTVDIKYVGRKGTMAVATLITGIFLFIFTTSKNSDFQLAFSSLVSFFQNIMYGVLYAYTPEIFPAPNRGTGTGVSSFLNRVGGLCAPLVAIYAANADPKAPIYASGGCMLAAFLAMLFLPLETRGKASL